MSNGGEQPQDASRPVSPGSAASAVGRIRDELDRLQDSLAQKEAHLDQREAQLNAAAAQLEARGRELAAYAQRLAQQRAQIEAERGDVLSQRSVIAQAQELERTLKLREASLCERERTMRRVLEKLKRQGRVLRRQRREHRRAVLNALPALTNRAPPAKASWRPAGVVAVATLVGLAVFALVPPVYSVRAEWERPDGSGLPIERVRAALADPAVRASAAPLLDPRTTWTPGRGPHTAIAEHRTRYPLETVRQVNEAALASLPALRRSLAPQSSHGEEVARLTTRRNELERELATATRPGSTAPTTLPAAGAVNILLARVDELAAQRQATQAEWQDVRARLAEAATRPAEADVVVPAEDRDRAQAADVELTQARRRWQENQEAVRSLLAEALRAAEPRFAAARRAIDEFVEAVESNRQSPPDPEAADELRAIQDEATKWRDRLAAMAAFWATARATTQPASDAIPRQRKLESAAQEYMAAADAQLKALEDRVQAIGEGGSQITKRVVVRSSLKKSLRQLSESHRELAARIKAVIAGSGGNFRLEAALRGAAGAGETIAARTAAIDARLIQQYREQARQEHEQRVNDLQRREQELAAKVSELTDAVVPAQAALQKLTRRWVASLADADRVLRAGLRRERLREERADVEARLEALRREAAAQAVEVRFTPACVDPRPINQRSRLTWALVTAAEVLVLGLLLTAPGTRARLTRLAGALRTRRGTPTAPKP